MLELSRELFLIMILMRLRFVVVDALLGLRLVDLDVSTRLILTQLSSNFKVILGDELVDVNSYIVRRILNIAPRFILIPSIFKISAVFNENDHSWLNLLI